MYSVLPAVAALVFLSLGCYVVLRKGWTPVSGSFFLLALSTFFWQSSWAVLFQIRDPQLASVLVVIGYLFILFLPTSIYHFLAEISESHDERRYVLLSYGIATLLSALLLSSDWLVAGTYDYFWGYYPKAGPLHGLHVLQTIVVVLRGIQITWQRQKEAYHYQQARLRYCITAMLIYLFAALDYLCNYGVEFYPPGVIFVMASLSIMAVAIFRYGLMNNPAALAASIAHEIRTPLATIQLQVQSIARYLPELFRGYQLAVEHKLCEPVIRQQHYDKVRTVSEQIEREVRQSNTIIDIALAVSQRNLHSQYDHHEHAMAHCVTDALESYPFSEDERQLVSLDISQDFLFSGSDTLIKYVLFNLMKNALYAIRQQGRGEIVIHLEQGVLYNRLIFEDSGPGIPASIRPYIFDDFFTTKKEGSGAGMGLAFCHRVIAGYNGSIECQSEHGQRTRFIITLPVLQIGGKVAGAAASS